jgi:choline transport protein
MLKEPIDAVLEQGADTDLLEPGDRAASEKRGNEYDSRDMDRMGKLPQLRVKSPES